MALNLSTLLLTTLTFLSAAVPVTSAPTSTCPRQANNRQQLTTSQLQTKQPTLTLPANTNATLQYVGLGVGIQNYTCASSSATPKSIGAIATLFDITSYLAACAQPQSSHLPTTYLKSYLRETSCQASTDLTDDTCEANINCLALPVLGKHYFAKVDGVAAGVPSFDITSQGTFLSAQKTGDVPAPAAAFNGTTKAVQGFGAVDWLFLPSDGSNRTVGLSEVYRINTAGGLADPNACATAEAGAVLSYKYAAEYWFFL